jgi:hypothetical protein
MSVELKGVLDLLDKWIEEQKTSGLHSVQFTYVVGDTKVTVQVSPLRSAADR